LIWSETKYLDIDLTAEPEIVTLTKDHHAVDVFHVIHVKKTSSKIQFCPLKKGVNFDLVQGFIE